MKQLVFLLVLVGSARMARAQDAPAPLPPASPTQPPLPPAPAQGDAPAPVIAGGCAKKDVARAPAQAPTGVELPSQSWREFDVAGTLRDPPDTVRALFAPVMSRYPVLSPNARADIGGVAQRFGYAVVAFETHDTPAGTQLVIKLAALPMVRKVVVDIKQSPFATLLDDQVKRRQRIRPGAYLPWPPADRACALDEERNRIADYLHFEEGYFDARVSLDEHQRGDGLDITIHISLGSKYRTGNVQIDSPEQLERSIDPRDIIKQFEHDTSWVFGGDRFTRVRHLDDIQRVVRLFQKKGFPAVRVHTTFEQDPASAFNRANHTVDFTVTIDPRRQLDVAFVGQNPEQLTDAQLRDHLTFNTAASSDDVEAANSANSLVEYLQSRGWFEAHVTYARERKQVTPDPSTAFDRIVFTIEQGRQRPVRQISFLGNKAFSADALEDELGTTQTKLSTSLFGGNTNATSKGLNEDVDRLAAFYHRAGYRDARVRVQVASDPSALGSAALTAAMVATSRGSGLYIRYVIEEGDPTLLTGVEVTMKDKTAVLPHELCLTALADLAELYGAKQLATPLPGERCASAASDLKYREDLAGATRDQLKDRMFRHGRPRTTVAYEPAVTGPRQVTARYALDSIQPLQFGKVVVRGNFKTKSSVILSELGLKQGALLTQDAFADGARRLRNTGLFDTVNLVMPDLDHTTAGEVNALVEVTERYDYKARVDAELGYSSYNGAFVKLIPSFKNLFGVGISFDVAGTIGYDLDRYLSTGESRLQQLSAEATLRFPQWLSRRFSPVEFQTEITAFHRRQNDTRFGVVTTDGATLTLSRTWERKRVGARPARAITTGVHYDFRLRERPIDVLRPAGADDDQTQVPVSTRTGSIGVSFEWEQRVNRQGSLSPLAPEGGFRLESQASIASNYLGGQDTFLKLSTAGTKYWEIGKNLTVRGDLRFDQGIPLGGAVLLPEVERFYAGGDSTVRGYDDERLATEIVQVGVPPLSNLQQIRVLPAGGNIRVMSSVDAQLRIWNVIATALFVDAGVIANQWGSVTTNDIRPSVGMALFRLVTPFGAVSIERAIPLRPQLGDDPRGRWHFSLAARTQF